MLAGAVACGLIAEALESWRPGVPRPPSAMDPGVPPQLMSAIVKVNRAVGVHPKLSETLQCLAVGYRSGLSLS